MASVRHPPPRRRSAASAPGRKGGDAGYMGNGYRVLGGRWSVGCRVPSRRFGVGGLWAARNRPPPDRVWPAARRVGCCATRTRHWAFAARIRRTAFRRRYSAFGHVSGSAAAAAGASTGSSGSKRRSIIRGGGCPVLACRLHQSNQESLCETNCAISPGATAAGSESGGIDPSPPHRPRRTSATSLQQQMGHRGLLFQSGPDLRTAAAPNAAARGSNTQHPTPSILRATLNTERRHVRKGETGGELNNDAACDPRRGSPQPSGGRGGDRSVGEGLPDLTDLFPDGVPVDARTALC